MPGQAGFSAARPRRLDDTPRRWVDPQEELIGVLLVQFVPNVPAYLEMMGRVSQALVD